MVSRTLINIPRELLNVAVEWGKVLILLLSQIGGTPYVNIGTYICLNKLGDSYKSTLLSCRVCEDLNGMIWHGKKFPL